MRRLANLKYPITSELKMEGKIVWYSPEKQMGLIKDASGTVHLVHKEQFARGGIDNLKVGSKIKFQLGQFPGFVDEVKKIKK